MNQGSILKFELVWHHVDKCCIDEHVFDMYNSWFLVMDGFVKELKSLGRGHMCVFSYRSTCWVQQGKITNILLCLFMH